MEGRKKDVERCRETRCALPRRGGGERCQCRCVFFGLPHVVLLMDALLLLSEWVMGWIQNQTDQGQTVWSRQQDAGTVADATKGRIDANRVSAACHVEIQV